MKFRLLALAGLAALARAASFNHSWDTMPVFWFSANQTGPESAAEQALIARYSVAILAWQYETEVAPAGRHGEDKLHAMAAALAATAPETQVLLYMQGQLAMDWYESTRAMLPPPCGTDAAGAFESFWLKDSTRQGRPAQWPSPFCNPNGTRGGSGGDRNYDFGQQKVRDHFVQEIALPYAAAPNVHGVWFDDTDWLPCHDMCDGEPHGMHLAPCDLAAKEALFNGTVAWKSDVARALNAQGKLPIYSSINAFDAPTATPGDLGHCVRNERQVTQEMAGLDYGRFYEGWGASCADIVNAQEEAEAGVAVFVNNYGRPLSTYVAAAFLVSAGAQSFLASSHCWVDPCTTWDPTFFDQPLGAPRGRARVDGSVWAREFEHVNVTLDCAKKTARLDGWVGAPTPAPTPPTQPPTPPPTLPPPPPKGSFGQAVNCTSCEQGGTASKTYPCPFSLAQCEAACAADAHCAFINFASNQPGGRGCDACKLYAACDPLWFNQGCKAPEWWTTYAYGR